MSINVSFAKNFPEIPAANGWHLMLIKKLTWFGLGRKIVGVYLTRAKDPIEALTKFGESGLMGQGRHEMMSRVFDINVPVPDMYVGQLLGVDETQALLSWLNGYQELKDRTAANG